MFWSSDVLRAAGGVLTPSTRVPLPFYTFSRMIVNSLLYGWREREVKRLKVKINTTSLGRLLFNKESRKQMKVNVLNWMKTPVRQLVFDLCVTSDTSLSGSIWKIDFGSILAMLKQHHVGYSTWKKLLYHWKGEKKEDK